MIFLDSNIVIDLVERVGRWSAWSRLAVADTAEAGFVTNAIVLTETAPQFGSSLEQSDYLSSINVAIVAISGAAAYRAGKAQQLYRERGGERTALVADFLIGGHAVDLGATLVTRDRQRFASYFPDLTLITPETHP